MSPPSFAEPLLKRTFQIHARQGSFSCNDSDVQPNGLYNVWLELMGYKLWPNVFTNVNDYGAQV
jgi:hypothetical protein